MADPAAFKAFKPEDFTPVDAAPSSAPEDYTPIESVPQAVGRSLKRGIVSGIPSLAGATLEAPSALGITTPGAPAALGKRLQEQAIARGQQPDVTTEGHPVLGQIGEAVSSSAPAVAAAMGGAALGSLAGPVGTVVGGIAGGVLGAIPYASQAGVEEKAKALKAGKSEEEAQTVARENAAAQGGIMAGMSFLPSAGGALTRAVMRGSGKTAADVATSFLAPRTGARMAGAAGESLAAGTAMMTGGAATQAAIEQAHGMGEQTPGEAALSSLPTSAGTALAFTPLAILGGYRNAVQRAALSRRLTDAGTDAKDRTAAVNTVAAEMAKVNEPDAKNWQRNANSAIRRGEPIDINESWTKGGPLAVAPPEPEAPAGVGGVDMTRAEKIDAIRKANAESAAAHEQQPPPAPPPAGGAPAGNIPEGIPDPLHTPDAGPISRAAAGAVDSGLTPDPYTMEPSEAHPERSEVTQPPDLQMQNRDRSRPGSIAQMNAIAANPDYDRLGPGKSPNEAAPLVSVGANAPTIPEEDFGHSSRVVLGDNSKIGFRYAVVEAGDVLASHNADGSVNGDYFGQVPPGTIRALNNGRIAGLQEAWNRGTADPYKEAMLADVTTTGIDPKAIEGKKNPILVRVYDDKENERPNIGALSNPQTMLKPSAPEQAQNDARLLDVSGLEADEDGNLINAKNDTALMHFVAALPKDEANELIDKHGRFSKQLADRVQAAVFAKAYGNAELVNIAAEERDPDMKNVLSALSAAAPDFARVEHGGPLDIRPPLIEAVHLLREAKARGMKPADMLAQQDMLGRDPLTQTLASFMAKNARSPTRLSAAFKSAARFLANERAASTSVDIFGRGPATMTDLLKSVNSHLEREHGNETQLAAAQKIAAITKGAEERAPAGGSRGAAPSPAHGGEPGAKQGTGAGKVAKLDYHPAETLSKPHRAIEDRFAARLSAPDAEEAYAKLKDSEGGKVISADVARELSPDYLKDRTLAPAVHEPASAFVKGVYQRKLAEAPKAGELPLVLFTAGGTGAGKTTGISAVPTAAKMKRQAQMVYDTNMNTYRSAKQKIDQALKAGKLVQIIYTYREPVDALVNGAIPRALRQHAEFGSGRTLTLETHLETHAGSLKVIREIAETYKDDPNVSIVVIDNSRGRNKAQAVRLEDLPEKYDNDVRKRLYEALEEQREKGLEESIYRGFLGDHKEARPTAGEVQRPGEQVRGGNAQQSEASRPHTVASPQRAPLPTEDRGGPGPKPGVPFIVFRVGSGSGLEGRNAGNAAGVARFLAHADDPFSSVVGAKGAKLTAYQVTLDKPFGKYAALNQGRGSASNAVGRVDRNGDVQYSFGKSGYTAEPIGDVDMTDLRARLKKAGYADFDESGSAEGAKHIRASFVASKQFELEGQTSGGLRLADEKARRTAAEAAKKAKAPPPESFSLTGSDRARDLLPGQREIFDRADSFIQKSLDDLPMRADNNAAAVEARQRAVRALTQRGRINLLAASINLDMLKTGQATLIGRKVTSFADLAAVAQVYRDPRYETLRYILVKGGSVVHETAVSSRLPAASAAFAGDYKDFMNDLRRAIERTGADGMYLLHNHPSGDPTPSDNDLNLTRAIGDVFPKKLLGHVVIDHDQYAVIEPGINRKKQAMIEEAQGHPSPPLSWAARVVEAPELKGAAPASSVAGAARPTPGTPAEDILGRKVLTFSAIFQVGKDLQSPDHLPLIGLDPNGKVAAIAELHIDRLDAGLRTQATVNRYARASGSGGGVVLLNVPKSKLKEAAALVMKGILREAVTVEGQSISESIRLAGAEPHPFIYGGRELPKAGIVARAGQKIDDLFGDAADVQVSYKKRIRTVAPALADLPSTQVDMFGQPTHTATEGAEHGSGQSGEGRPQGEKPGVLPPTGSGDKAGELLPGAGERDTGSGVEHGERQPGREEGVQPGEQTNAGPEGGGGEHAAGERDGARPGRLPGIPAGRDIPAKTGRNFAFGADDLNYAGGWLTKGRQNLEAIKLLATLEAEGRQATREEQAVLGRYVGWGASELANKIFSVDNRKAYDLPESWRQLRTEIRDTLTEQQFTDASKSTQYAHWTSKDVVRGMWDGVRRLGYDGGAILEPGAGIGVFPGLMRPDLANNSVYTGIEYDPITGGILKQLFPDERIIVGDFIKTPLPRDFYDLAIGNWPFSSTPILADPDYRNHSFALHDYFFAKTLDRVKPGGLVVAVTSHYTMDKLRDKARSYVGERADLVGAIRLPQTAFKKNAGTEVVTDVLFLRKKVPGETFDQAKDWLDVRGATGADGKPLVGRDGKPLFINQYFADHPEMVLGTHSAEGTMRARGEYTVLPTEGADIEEQFRKAVAKLPEGVYRPDLGTSSNAAKVQHMDLDPKAKKEGGFYLSPSGAIMRMQGGVGVPFPAMGHTALLRSYVPLRDALKQAQYDQLNNGPWEESLTALQKAYRAFVGTHGRIRSNTPYERTTSVTDPTTGETTETPVKYRRWTHQKTLIQDPDYWLVAALEHVNEDTDEITEAAPLRERTLERPQEPKIDTPADALLASLNDLGKVDIKRIAELAGVSEQEAIAGLEGAIFRVPSGEYQTSDEYLSGDVRKKLEEAQAAAAADRSFESNVAALKRVQPREKPHAEIDVRLGMNFIPASVYEQFANERLGTHVGVSFVKATGRWVLDPSGRRSEFDTGGMAAGTILSHVMNGSPIRVEKTEPQDSGPPKVVLDVDQTAAANAKAKEIQAAFATWLWTDKERTEQLTGTYNDTFNTVVPRQFNGDHLTLPGTSKLFNVFPHVKRGAWRIIQAGNTYLAHAVGSGKTFEMVISAMEQKRLGLIKKPLFAVPKHMLAQFASEWQSLYPTARLMIADEANFHTDVRREFVSRAALTDLDGIVMTHSSFNLLDLDPAFKKTMIEREVESYRQALIEAGGDGVPEYSRSGKRVYSRDPKIKQIEHALEQLQQKLDALASSAGKDKGSPRFDEMGVDMLYVDEGHEFRRLGFATQRQIKGIQPAGSDRAFDLWMKSRWLEEKKPGRSLVMASGTPVTNTVAELYNVMRFMDPRALEERGISRFDEWASMFGREDTQLEPNAAGQYEQVTRFTRFANLPELAQLFRNFADVLSASDLGKLLGDKRPTVKGGSRKIVLAPMTPELRAYREELRVRMNASKEWKPSFSEPNNPDPIIRIIGDGRLAAIDMRFANPSLPSNPKSKLNVMADAVIARYKQSNEPGAPVDRQTQLVFSDLGFGEGVTHRRGFNARAWFEHRLVEGGIPRSEIAFINDYNTAQKRLDLFRRMNEGKVRILTGASRNLGTGTNVQKRAVALHHLDTPWFPAHVEQREGRLIRAGNLNKEVETYGYATKGSYDETMWKLVATKQRFIDQALSGDPNLRSIEDVSEVSNYEMASALLADDERVLRLAGLRSEVEQLYRLYGAHQDDVASAERTIRMAEGQIDRLEKRAIPEAEKVAAKVQDLSGDKFKATIGSIPYGKRKEFGEALINKFKALAAKITQGEEPLGSISGFPITFKGLVGRDPKGKVISYDTTATLHIGDHAIELTRDGADDPLGIAMRVGNAVADAARTPARMKEYLAQQKAEVHALRPKVGSKFPMLEELREKQGELRELEDDIEKRPYADPTEEQAPVEEPPIEEPPPVGQQQRPFGPDGTPPPNARGGRERAGRGPTEPNREARRSAFSYTMYQGVAEQPRGTLKGAVLDALKRFFLPSTRGKLASMQAGIMRANLGRMAREAEIANVSFRRYAKAFNALSQADQVAFINRYERNEAQPTQALTEAASAMHEFNRQLRQELQALGKLDEFNEHYLGRIWLDPEDKVRSVFARRPLEGSKNFLKRRTYDYFSQGLDAGLKPITYNPVEMMLLKGVEQRRFIYAQKIGLEMREAGLVRQVKYGAKAPEGWTALNDKIFSPGSFGPYYAPDQAAALFNNHLSPGLRGNAAYDMFHRAGMLLNSAQLGLSLFHAGFTTIDAMVSKGALGFQQLSRGQWLKGFGSIVQSVNPAQPFINAYRGDRLLRAYMGQLNDPALAPIVQALLQGGGRAKMDEFYRNAAINSLKQAIERNDKLGVAKALLPSLLDRINAPIFEQLVPRQKLGVFFDLAKDWLERNPNAGLAEKREAMGRFWDSVDNRMGQLAYDNVFWNRTLKDLLMVTVRSVGWNLGTFRELGGGVLDVASIARNKELSSRTAYAVALPFVTGLIGSIVGYLYTGKGPEDLKDYFFPKTGRTRPDGSDDRVSLPSYMKDVYEYGHDISGFLKYGANPTQTLQNKLHPMLGVIAQMLSNQDFFGGAIRSPGDPAMVQLADEAKYLADQIMPFSVRNFAQQQKVKGESGFDPLGYATSPSMIGITPSPGYITKSDAQTEAAALGRMKDSLITKFRTEIQNGDDVQIVARRAFAAGLRLPEVTMLVRQGMSEKRVSRTPPRALRPNA